MEKTVVCNRCGETDSAKFYKRGNGFKTPCKTCIAKYRKDYYKDLRSKTTIDKQKVLNMDKQIAAMLKKVQAACKNFLEPEKLEKENYEMKRILWEIKEACYKKKSSKLKYAIDSAEKYIRSYKE